MLLPSLIPAFTLVVAMNTPDGDQRSAGPDAGAEIAVETTAQAQPARVCSQSAWVVAINVVDAAGKPIPGVTVTMTRLRDKKSLGNATEMRPGLSEFVLFQSDALQWLAPKGDRIRLRVTAGARTTTAVIVVGRDPTGCKVVQLSGPGVITLK